MKENKLIETYNNLKKVDILKRDAQTIQLMVEELMSRMTLAEKAGQMYQGSHYGAELVGPSIDSSDTVDLIKQGRVGSVLSVSNKKIQFRLQKMAVEDSRLGIPLLYAYDVVHGYKTIFPINLAMACSWDQEIIRKTSGVAASEAARAGIHMTFAPMLDVVKDPRWGRVMESFGEDHYLGAVYAKAYVEGFQQETLTSRDALAACAKHFIGYGLSEAGREYNSVDLSEMKLRQEYLPPFKAAIDAGVSSIMTAFNVVDGIPATGNKKLLRDLLKGECAFDGVIISDYESSGEMMYHKTAENLREVAKNALLAGLDMEMVTKSYVAHIESLVNEDKDLLTYVDDSVRRILTLKYELGLFDDPYKGLTDDSSDYFLTEENRSVAYEAAVKSIVLLENDGVLPLKKDTKIGLVGPFASSHAVNGSWAALGRHEDTVSLAEGFKSNVTICEGCSITGDDLITMDTLQNTLENVDVIVLAVGEDESMSGEGASRAFLDLPGHQQKLMEMVTSLGKPLVTIIFSGRPLDLRSSKAVSNALIQGWFLGSESGHALADIILGHAQPSGKLAMSMPYCVGQVPVYYNQLPTGRPAKIHEFQNRFTSSYIDIPNEPLYPFGYGLTYSTFVYSDLELSKNRMHQNETVNVQFNLTNTGKYTATETVQLYLESTHHSVGRPDRELKLFKQVILNPGEHTRVGFDIDYDTLTYIDDQMMTSASPGLYKIHIGENSRDTMFSKDIMLEVL